MGTPLANKLFKDLYDIVCIYAKQADELDDKEYSPYIIEILSGIGTLLTHTILNCGSSNPIRLSDDVCEIIRRNVMHEVNRMKLKEENDEDGNEDLI